MLFTNAAFKMLKIYAIHLPYAYRQLLYTRAIDDCFAFISDRVDANCSTFRSFTHQLYQPGLLARRCWQSYTVSWRLAIPKLPWLLDSIKPNRAMRAGSSPKRFFRICSSGTFSGFLMMTAPWRQPADFFGVGGKLIVTCCCIKQLKTYWRLDNAFKNFEGGDGPVAHTGSRPD